MLHYKIPGAILSCMAALFLFSSCSKNNPDSNPVFNPNPGSDPLHIYTQADTNYDHSHLNQLFSAFRSVPQTLTVNAGQYWRVYGAAGTMLSFYPNSFKDQAGNIISSGTIQLTLVEMYKPGAMIANRASATVDGGLLLSGGEIYINATMNNQPVYANKYGVGFIRDAPSSQPMSLYYGNTNNPDSIVNWSLTNVINSGTTVTGTVLLSDSAQAGPWQGPPPPVPGPHYYFLFDSCTNFQTINCDHFSGYPNLTGVTAVAPDTTFNPSNTTVYLVFPDINSVTHFNHYTVSGALFTLSSGYHVPQGMTVSIVAMTNKNGVYFYYELPNVTVTQDMTVNLDMQQQSYAYITNALLNL